MGNRCVDVFKAVRVGFNALERLAGRRTAGKLLDDDVFIERIFTAAFR